MNVVKHSLLILGAVVGVAGVDRPALADTESVALPAGGIRPVGPCGWRDFDVNDDGGVTAAEFTEASKTIAAAMQAKFLEKYDRVPTGQTVGDGTVTTAEAKAVIEAGVADWVDHLLEIYDANDDGAIAADELTAKHRGRGGHGDLADLDANDDGAISKEEIAAAAAERVADRLESFLEKYDGIPTGATAGDGNITSAESLAVFETLVAARVEAVSTRYDANKDGSVTAAEIASVDQVRPVGRGGSGGRGRR